MAHHNFWLLVTATLVAGYYSANGQLYRFAAAELALPAFREKAVSMVLAGGLMGAVLGPNMASRTRTMTEVPFMGAYLALAVVAVLAMAVMAMVTFPPIPPKAKGADGKDDHGRPLGVIMRQPGATSSAAAKRYSWPLAL